MIERLFESEKIISKPQNSSQNEAQDKDSFLHLMSLISSFHEWSLELRLSMIISSNELQSNMKHEDDSYVCLMLNS